jgi:predicted transcriptional regulator
MSKTTKLPCELIIWYVLPDFRNEISRTLLDEYDYKQVEIAKTLGVTKAAVNQYLSSKRGDNFFSLIKDKKTKNMIMKEIKKSTASIVNEQSTIDIELCRLCNVIKSDKIIVKVYEKYSANSVPSCIAVVDENAVKTDVKISKNKKAKCPECNKDIQSDWLACPFCGNKVGKTCPECNKAVELTWKVCPFCAKNLSTKNTKGTTKGKKKA